MLALLFLFAFLGASPMAEQLININALQQCIVKEEPFPYVVIPNFLQSAYVNPLVESFPKIKSRGSIPASSISLAPLFARLIAELEGEELKQIIAQKFAIDLANRPTILTLRGHTNERDGFIHVDSKSKLITLLLYMNATWESEAGHLCLLKNNHSLDDYVEKISPLAGTCLIFKVTPNCWHGHQPFIGKRLSLQLNYLTKEAALTKQLNHHRFTAWLKQKFPRLLQSVDRNY